MSSLGIFLLLVGTVCLICGLFFVVNGIRVRANFVSGFAPGLTLVALAICAFVSAQGW